MSKISVFYRLAVAAVLMGSAIVAQSTPVIYDTPAAFLAAVDHPSIDLFDALDLDDNDQLTRAVGPYGYTATVAGGFVAEGSGMDGWLSTNNALPIVFGSFTGGVTAIGGYFFATDYNGDLLGGESVFVTVTDTSGVVSRKLIDPLVTTFLGFVSDRAIRSLEMGIVDTGFNNGFATANNLTLASSVAAVPEPSSLLLMFAGLAGVALWTASRSRRPSDRFKEDSNTAWNSGGGWTKRE